MKGRLLPSHFNHWLFGHICHFHHMPKLPLSKGALLPSHWHLSHIRWRIWRICHFRHSPISPKFANFANNRRFPRGPSWLLICICHTFVGDFGEFFRHIRQFRQSPLSKGALLASHFCHTFAILANSPFLPYSPISPKSPLSKGALLASHWHLSHIRRRFWRIRHFCHIRQFRQNRRFPRGPSCLLICICHTFVGDFGEFAIFAIFANFAKIAAFQGGPLVFSFAFATHSLAILANSPFLPYSPISPKSPLSKGALLSSHLHLPYIRWRFWRMCHFRHIRQFRQNRRFPRGPSWLHIGICHTFAGDFGEFAIFAIFAIRQFRQNRRFPRGPSCLLICICHTFVGDFGESAIFAIFANFAKIAAFQGGPLGFTLAFVTHSPTILANSPFLPYSPISPKSPLSKGALLSSHLHLPHIRWRFWRIRHFRHIRQFRQNRHFPRGPSCLLICICHTFAGDFGEFAIFAIFAIIP